MNLTYETTFGSNRRSALVVTAVLLLGATACSGSSGSSGNQALVNIINQADSQCKSAGDYCSCMWSAMNNAINEALQNGQITQQQADQMHSANRTASDNCDASGTESKNFWINQLPP